MVKFTFASLLLVTLITTSCGGGDDPSHMLVSLQVTPGSAEGNAQFTAIGTFADGYTATIAALALRCSDQLVRNRSIQEVPT